MTTEYSTKISALSSATLIGESDVLPISVRKSETQGLTLDTLREALGFENAYTSLALALLGTKDGDIFYLFEDSNKEWVGKYKNVQGAGVIVKDASGLPVRHLTRNKVDRLDIEKAPANFLKKGNFNKGGTITAANEVFLSGNYWYQAKGKTLPYTVTAGTSPDSDFFCLGLLNGFGIDDVRNWGIVGDGVTDNTAQLKAVMKYSELIGRFYFPAGVYCFSDLGSIKLNRTTWRGDGGLQTIFKCINPVTDHVAFTIDAFLNNSDNDGFIDGFNISGIHFEGNSKTKTVLSVQGVSRSIWADVSAWGATGTAIVFKGVMLSNLGDLCCSVYRARDAVKTLKPTIGLQITQGSRAGKSIGACSNNVFTALKMEGLSVGGMSMEFADNNVFVSGTCEANVSYGTTITANCRYNVFMGMGNENTTATTADFIDKGYQSKFINCYSSKRIVLQGYNGVIDGGYFDLVEVQATAVGSEVKNIRVNHWSNGSGGLTDNGAGTIKYNVFDRATNDFLNTTGVRKSAALTTEAVDGGTKGTWVNTTRLPVTFYIVGTGTFAFAAIYRAGDYVDISLASRQQVHLEAGDSIVLTWTTATTQPTTSYRTKNGWN